MLIVWLFHRLFWSRIAKASTEWNIMSNNPFSEHQKRDARIVLWDQPKTFEYQKQWQKSYQKYESRIRQISIWFLSASVSILLDNFDKVCSTLSRQNVIVICQDASWWRLFWLKVPKAIWIKNCRLKDYHASKIFYWTHE